MYVLQSLRRGPAPCRWEFYGLYSMVGRFAAVIGPALWAFVAVTLGMGRPAALASLVVMIGIAFAILKAEAVAHEVQGFTREPRYCVGRAVAEVRAAGWRTHSSSQGA